MLAICSVMMISALGCAENSPFTQSSTKWMAAYIKAWGFLKYYHPDVTQGKVNWDSTFLAQYQKACSCNDAKDFSIIASDLIHTAGGVKSYGYRSPDELKVLDESDTNLLDLRWLKDRSLVTPDIQRSLDSIRSNVVPEWTSYVVHGESGTSDVGSDVAHDSDVTTTMPVRMLALARYWNVIEYFAPDKDVIGESWDSILYRFIPRIAASTTESEYQLAMAECCNSIHDTHSYTSSATIDSILGQYVLPIRLSRIEGKVIVRRPCLGISTSLKPGDEILAINGMRLSDRRKTLAKLASASNDAALERNICWWMTRCAYKDSVLIEYRSVNGIQSCKVKPLTIEEFKKIVEIDSSKHWKILDGNIGFVNMGELTVAEVKQAMSDLARTKAIIFDVRNYPKGTLWSLATYLRVNAPWVSWRRPDFHSPGSFIRESSQTNSYLSSTKGYRGRVIVLVNENTQSHAEYTAMMLRRAERSVVIGSQTAGADGNVVRMTLPGGIHTIFSGLGVFYPDGKPTQRVGIVPDIHVEPTIAGLRAGRDEVLERAIEVAKE